MITRDSVRWIVQRLSGRFASDPKRRFRALAGWIRRMCHGRRPLDEEEQRKRIEQLMSLLS